MNLPKTLQSLDAELPAALNGQYSKLLKSKFDAYINALNAFTPHPKTPEQPDKNGYDNIIKSAIPNVREIADSISKAIDAYFRNEREEFHDDISKIIQKYKIEFEKLISQPQSSETAAINQDLRFFRARLVEENGKVFSSKDMFHIPGDKRHICKTYRYSSPGIPGLYLGASSYVCWEELRRPSLSNFQIVEYKIKAGQSINFLDFGYRPSLLGRLLDGNTGYLPSHFDKLVYPRILLWPLICAASIKVNYATGSFLEEYVIPQFLLQDPKVAFKYDGIRYFSSRLPYNIIDSLINTCYAFTADDLHANAYSSKLMDIFEVSETLDCNLLQSILGHSKIAAKGARKGAIEILSNSSTRYANTLFSEIDDLLSKSKFSAI